jgi:hypothetical protein
MKTTTTATPGQKLQAASAAIRDGEARGLGERAMAKRYKALFAAEDAVKASGGWR